MRIEGWELRLAEAVEAGLETPFQWGVNDCVTWACDVRLALTGEDAAAAWRGRYSTAAGSQRVLRRMGWTDLEAGARAILGEPLASPLRAMRGDIALCTAGFGVVIGSEAVGMSEAGMTSVPLRLCRLAWRV